MLKIKCLNPISETVIQEFMNQSLDLSSPTDIPDGLIVRSNKVNSNEIPNSVKAIARAGSGVNNIPVANCTEKGIVVFNTPGANANSVKELVLGSLFVGARNLIQGVKWAESLEKNSLIPTAVEKGKKQFAGSEIYGKKLGIIGLGAIGVLVANDALALGMDVIGYDPFISVETAWNLSSQVKRAANLEEIFAACDFITIHVPLTVETKEFVDEHLLSMLKPGARLLNFSRGELVDEQALEHSLAKGTLNTYITDFPNERVLSMPNVIPIPHLGASTKESEENCARMAIKQLRDYLESGNIKNSVNFPDVSLPFYLNKRITVAHQNIPNMVGQITTILAQHNINIADMLNRSKGSWAYTMIDIDGVVTEEIERKISQIKGVVSVRVYRKGKA